MLALPWAFQNGGLVFSAIGEYVRKPLDPDVQPVPTPSFCPLIIPPVLNVAGTILLAMWNFYCVDRLLACKELLDSVASGAEDVESNAVYGFIGKRSLGPWGESSRLRVQDRRVSSGCTDVILWLSMDAGSRLVNTCIFLTLFGCCVTFLIISTQLIESTPLSIL